MSRSILSEEEQSQQSNNNNNGLFGLTEIKIKEKQQEKQQQQVSSDIPHVSLQNKLISMLNLSQYTTKSYKDYGPFQPGYNFFQLLIHSKNLDIPIPDTIIVEGGLVYHLYNGKHGYIEKSKPNYETIEYWIGKVMDRFVLTSSPSSPKSENEPLCLRTVGVVKKQLWKTHIMNHTETLSALGVQAYIVQGIKAGNHDQFILQKFIKCRGRRPCFNRIFWRAGSEANATNKTLAGWNITSKFDFAKNPLSQTSPTNRTTKGSVDPQQNTTHNRFYEQQHQQEQHQQDYHHDNDEHHNSHRNSDALNLFSTIPSDEKFLELLRSLYEMNSAESAAFKLKDSQNYRSYGYRNICSLTDEVEDKVTSKHSETITVTKLSSRAIEGSMTIINRIVQFLESLALRKYGCSISVIEIVCDFIRDEDDRLYLTQIKGFRLSTSSLASIKNYIRHQEEASDLDDEDRVDAAEEYRNKIKNAKEKQQDSMGNICKLCGMIFPEGAEIPDPLDIKSKSEIKSTPENEEESIKTKKTKMIPCFGYRITDRMAYSLAATYRDNELPLTAYAREMLLEEAQHSQVGLSKPPISLADGHHHQSRRKRLGTIEVCVHCIKIFEETCQYKTAAEKLYTTLGVGSGAAGTTINKSQDISVVDVFDISPMKNQSRLHKKNDPKKTSKQQLISRDNSASKLQLNPDIETHCNYHGQISPWTSAHFERGTEEWRVFIMFHNLLDVKCIPTHPLHNAFGHITYTLGQSIQDLPFRLFSGDVEKPDSALSVGNFASGIVSVRQCRLHYLFSSKNSAAELFSQKRLEFHLHFAPNDKTANTEFEELLWEATFSLDLGRLNWFSKDLLAGREKIDVLVPIETKTLGNIVAKISVGIAISPHLPNLNDFTFHREKRCFWPPTEYHDVQPLPEAWIAMLTSKDRSTVFKLQENRDLKSKNLNRQLENAVLMLKYSHFIRKVFEDQEISIDGTVNGPKLLMELYQTLGNEMTYLSQEDKSVLIPFQQALRGIIEDADLETRITFESFSRTVEKYLNEPKVYHHSNDEVDSNEDDRDKVDFSKFSKSHEAGGRTTRRTLRLSHTLKTMKSHSFSKAESFKSHSFKEEIDYDQFGSREYDMVGLISSEERKKRRFECLQIIFDAVCAESDVIDIAELKQYLVEERDKLTQVLNLVKVNLMKLPSVSATYDTALHTKFSLIRSVICCHLLTSSEKLNKLYHAYDTLGVSIISKVGFLSSCELCWKTIALTRSVAEYNPIVQELIWISRQLEETNKNFRETNKIPPSLITLTCDIHGVGYFYLADLCCVKCEIEVYKKNEEDIDEEDDNDNNNSNNDNNNNNPIEDKEITKEGEKSREQRRESPIQVQKIENIHKVEDNKDEEDEEDEEEDDDEEDFDDEEM